MGFTELTVQPPAVVSPAPSTTAPAASPITLPSPGVAMALSLSTTFAGVGLFTAGVITKGDNIQLALVGSGIVLMAVGPWTGRRYGNAVTSPWRNVRLVGLAASAVGVIGVPVCLAEGSDTTCGIAVGLMALGSMVFACGTMAELANTASDVRKAQATRVAPTVGPVPGGATLGLSGTF